MSRVSRRMSKVVGRVVVERSDPTAVSRELWKGLVKFNREQILDEEVIRRLRPELILTQRLCDVCAPAYGSVQGFASTSRCVRGLLHSTRGDACSKKANWTPDPSRRNCEGAVPQGRC